MKDRKTGKVREKEAEEERNEGRDGEGRKETKKKKEGRKKGGREEKKGRQEGKE